MDNQSKKDRLIQKVLEDPENITLRQTLAEVYLKEEQYAEALTESGKAVKIDPELKYTV